MVNVLEPIVHLLHVKTPSTCVKDNYTACTIKVQDKKKKSHSHPWNDMKYVMSL